MKRKLSPKLGSCVVCGSKVYSDDLYIKAAEGYCHRRCVFGDGITA